MKKILVLFLLVVVCGGCAVVLQKGRRSDVEKIRTLEGELDQLRQTKSLLEEKLSKEIEDKQVSLDMQDKGLVITFVAEVLFASGKADLKKESYSALEKVASILREELSDNNIGIEGHTDDQPIKYSGWKSNWELSSHRALSVLYYLEENGIVPERLAAIGYGQYHPVASNEDVEGRQLNRRVEIVIFPKEVTRSQRSDAQETDGVHEEEVK